MFVHFAPNAQQNSEDIEVANSLLNDMHGDFVQRGKNPTTPDEAAMAAAGMSFIAIAREGLKGFKGWRMILGATMRLAEIYNIKPDQPGEFAGLLSIMSHCDLLSQQSSRKCAREGSFCTLRWVICQSWGLRAPKI